VRLSRPMRGSLKLFRWLESLKISLALSGGAARGAFHLGVIAACERHGIEIGAISGTSIGAVVATGVGSGVSAFDMIRLFKSEAFRKVIGFNYFQKGLFRIDETASILREICPVSSLEEMRIPTFYNLRGYAHRRDHAF
jgi:NTE family protein